MIHLFLSLLWLAQPLPFHSAANVSCPTGAISCRVELPLWTYRVLSPEGDGQDWSFLSTEREPLPWRPSLAPAMAQSHVFKLPFMPLANLELENAAAKWTIQSLEGRLMVRWENATTPMARTSAWIVDTRGRSCQELELQTSGQFLGEMDIETSSDLIHWSMQITSHAVADLQNGGFRALRNRLPGIDDASFLRLRFHLLQGDMALNTISCRQKFTAIASRGTSIETRLMEDSDSGWTYSWEGRPPVVGAFIDLPSEGGWAEFALDHRSNPRLPWTEVARQTSWRWSPAGKPMQQDTLIFQSVLRDGWWRLRPIGPKATVGSAPRLVLVVHPDVAEVATGGKPLLLLAAGQHPSRRSPRQFLSSTLPASPPTGLVQEPRLEAGTAAWKAPPPTRLWILGGTLALFLLGLAFVAWKLLREAFGSGSKPPPPDAAA